METLISLDTYFFFCPNMPAFRRKKIIENVGRRQKRVVSCRAACNVEASTAQRYSTKTATTMSPVRIFWPELFFYYSFFCTLYNEKNYFCNRKHFLRFFKKKKLFKNDCFIGKT